MNILFLADAVFSDKPGGSRMAAQELANRLQERGHRITYLVGRPESGPINDAGNGSAKIVRYEGAGNASAYYHEGRAACAELLKVEKFDVVHTHFAYSARGPLSVLPASVARVRTFHGPWDAEGWVEDVNESTGPIGRAKALVKRRLRYQVELDNLKASLKIVVLSEYFRNELINRFRISPKLITKIPGGVDSARFAPAANRSEVREELGLSSDRPILFTVRRLAARMGLENLILAMPQVVKSVPNVLLLIGGKGPQREYLERLIAEHHLSGNVELLGYISDDHLPKYYQSADLFVLPTIALEGFGLVTAEALASGTPVLGTPIGATPELLSPIDPRMVADGITPNDLAKGILECYSCIQSTSWRSDKLANYAREHFDWNRNALQTERLYLETIDENRRAKV